MRVLCQMTSRPSIARGWGRALEYAGHQVSLWEPGRKPAFDAFDEANPQLFVRTGPETRAMERYLAPRRDIRVVAREDPDPAADTFLYGDASPHEGLACDFCHIGDYRPHKALLLNSHVLPLSSRGKLRIFGDGPWPTCDCLGVAPERSEKTIYASATVSLHVTSSGRTSGRVYNALLAGGVCVSNELKDSPIPGNIVIRGLTPAEFRDLAIGLINPKLANWRREVIRRGKEFILNGHTYWHRAAGILDEAGFGREATKLLEVFRATVRI
jgi:hypothetical protein